MMKVRLCEECRHYRRKTWSSYYRPKSGRGVGMTHAYGYCMKHNERCSMIKNCDDVKTELVTHLDGEEAAEDGGMCRL